MTCYPFDDLRFTHEETQSFLAKIIGYPLSEKDMVFFENKVEGWIAGIQMAWIASHRWEEAFDLLQRLSVEAEAGKRFGRLLKINILRILSMDTLGYREEALDYLENCLEFARLEGYVRVFLDQGAPMKELILGGKQTGRWQTGELQGYVDSLLLAF